MKKALCLLTGIALVAASASADDWPQWRGAERDAISKETGLLKKWPDGGPERVWMYKNAGQGYSGFAVKDGKLFTMGTRDGGEILLALDAKTGGELWATKISDTILDNAWGDGPRGTPAVDDQRVYALSGTGNLVAADIRNGDIGWKKNMEELGGKIPRWGYAESVLLDGDKVLVTPGGPQGAIVAFNKGTGEKIWQSKDFTDYAHYSSIVPAEINGQKQYVQLTEESVVGLDAETGKLLWETDWPGRTAVIPTPIVKNNEVYVTSGYGVGSKKVRIKPGNEVEEVYFNKVMKNHHGGVVLIDGHVYGHSDGPGWVAQNWETGEMAWNERSALGKGATSTADGRLYLLDERSGTVVLAEPSAEGWKEHGRFRLDPQSEIRSNRGAVWTHPVIANGTLYLRDQDLIYAYDVKAE